MSRAEKKKILFTKVVNYLKPLYPNLNWEILHQTGIELDPTVTDSSGTKKDLTSFKNSLKFPIFQPIRDAIDEITSTQKKKDLDVLNGALEVLASDYNPDPKELKKKKIKKPKKNTSIDILDNSTPMDQDDSASTQKTSKKRKLSETNIVKPIKTPAPKRKKIDRRSSNDKYLTEFDNPVRKICFNKQMKFWTPHLPTENNKKSSVACYCGYKSAMSQSRFGKKVWQLSCPTPNFKMQCGFLINVKSMSRLNAFMAEKKILRIPRPQCSCDGENTILQIRGSDPDVKDHQLYYFCPSCKNCYYFDEHEESILKALEEKPKKKPSPAPPKPVEPPSTGQPEDEQESSDEEGSSSESEVSESEDEQNEDEESSEDEDGN